MVKQINIPLEESEHEAFKLACEKKGLSMRAYLLECIERLIREQEAS
jgi:hypothetical protein